MCSNAKKKTRRIRKKYTNKCAQPHCYTFMAPSPFSGFWWKWHRKYVAWRRIDVQATIETIEILCVKRRSSRNICHVEFRMSGWIVFVLNNSVKAHEAKTLFTNSNLSMGSFTCIFPQIKRQTRVLWLRTFIFSVSMQLFPLRDLENIASIFCRVCCACA